MARGLILSRNQAISCLNMSDGNPGSSSDSDSKYDLIPMAKIVGVYHRVSGVPGASGCSLCRINPTNEFHASMGKES